MTLSLRRALLVLVAAAVTCQAIITHDELVEKSAKGLMLIERDPTVDPVWMTQEEKLQLIRANVNFFDVTETYEPPSSAVGSDTARAGTVSYPAPSRKADITPLLNKISLTTMQSYLSNLTNFNNRYYKSATGVAASVWIKDTIQSIISNFPASGASVALYPHTFVQSSIIAKIPGTNSVGPLVILGAHMDSINSANTAGRAPGADDDGSGTVNLMEAFRVLVTSGFQATNPVEFHWYAGEEAGLLGSQVIAKDYKAKNLQVRGMLQLDMTAYVKPGSKEVIALMPDYTNANLTNFIGALVDTYSTIGWTINNACGYGCSDHASWDRQGYPTALPFESVYPTNENQNIHGSGDTVSVSGFSWSHTLEYTKIALAYAYELGI